MSLVINLLGIDDFAWSLVIQIRFIFFNQPNFQFNGENSEMRIRILHSFLDRSISIIMDYC